MKSRKLNKKTIKLIKYRNNFFSERVFDRIERMWDLAVSSPENLVAAFEIVEMQQEYNDRRDAREKKRLVAAATNTHSSTSVDAGRFGDGCYTSFLQIY